MIIPYATRKSSAMRIFLLVGCICSSAVAKTLRDIIVENDDISYFRSALEAVGDLEEFLDDPDGEYTVFAPLNEAVDANDVFKLYLNGVDARPPRWHFHLEKSVRFHMIEGTAMTQEELFSTTTDHVNGMGGPLQLSQFLKVIEGARIEVANIQADNGILHLVNKVFKPEFYDHTFANLELQSEFGPDWLDRVSLQTITDFVDGRDVFRQFRAEGQTMVGCRIRALNRIGVDYLPQTINDSSDVKYGEFMNSSFKAETKQNLLEYSVVPKLYYRLDIPDRFQELIMSSNECAHMWVTKASNGRLCFNDGCGVATPEEREFFSSNGFGYVIDKCIVCPGVAMLVEYAAEFTIYNMKDMAQFLVASEWNRRNLSRSVGNGDLITMFASADSGFNVFYTDDTLRLTTPKWFYHMWDFLRHSMLQGVFFESDFKDMWHSNGGAYNLTSLAGQNISIDYDTERDVVLVEGGDLWYPDIKGVDGRVHFTTKLPLPESVTHSVYDIAKKYTNYSQQILLIDTVFLQDDMRRLLPLTAFFAPDEDWAGKIIALEDISKSVLENHLIENIYRCSDFVARAGQRIESLNGQTWHITVNEEGFPCFDTVNELGGEIMKSCVVECDILARNGYVHFLDKVLLFDQPETYGPQIPTFPTNFQPNAPSFWKKPSPTPGQNIPRSSFYGPLNPAYAPLDDPDWGNSASFSRTGVILSIALPIALVFINWARH